MTIDQVIHAAMAVGALLTALVGFLAREQLSDLKTGVKELANKIDLLKETDALHGERIAALEAQNPPSRASTHTAVNGRGRG